MEWGTRCCCRYSQQTVAELEALVHDPAAGDVGVRIADVVAWFGAGGRERDIETELLLHQELQGVGE